MRCRVRWNRVLYWSTWVLLLGGSAALGYITARYPGSWRHPSPLQFVGGVVLFACAARILYDCIEVKLNTRK